MASDQDVEHRLKVALANRYTIERIGNSIFAEHTILSEFQPIPPDMALSSPPSIRVKHQSPQ